MNINIRNPDPIIEPTREIKEEIYKLYTSVFNSELKDKRIKLMTYIFAWYPWSWRVVGISKGAVDRISLEGYYPLPKKLQRDHFLQSRNDTYKIMLEGAHKMPFTEWWTLFWENDPTIIMTKDEHDTGRGSIKCHKLDWTDGYFAGNSLIGFKFRKKTEAAYIQYLNEENQFQWVSVEDIKNYQN